MPEYEVVVIESTGQSECHLRDFLSLPKTLYPRGTCPQNRADEEALLRGTHVLSKCFCTATILVYVDHMVSARCLLCYYPGDKTCYLGFYECIRDKHCSHTLFETAEKHALANDCTSLKGPVNASFWIGYRLKIDHFEGRPYFGEPYNLDYYADQFRASGFEVIETYLSSCYEKPPLFDKRTGKARRRLDRFKALGYTFKSPSASRFEVTLREICRLINDLYKDFPIYKPISEDDFIALFSGFRHIYIRSLVQLAYFEKEPVGFLIGFPDYGNILAGKVSPFVFFRVLLKKIRSNRYIVLYVGAKPGHYGLGNAMSANVRRLVRHKRAASIAALVRTGKPTGRYNHDHLIGTQRYVLLEKRLEQSGQN